MKLSTRTARLFIITFFMGFSFAQAGEVTIPNTFQSGTPAVAAEVNANFTAVETAVDDNDSRIATLESSVADMTRADGPCFDNENRYVDCGNGTVTDTVTGLIWLQDANCFGQQTYADANNSALSLEHGDCGLTDNSMPGDWRLPTIAEWEATVQRAIDLSCTDPSLTDTSGEICASTTLPPFSNIQSAYYWSSTTYSVTPGNAEAIILYSGSQGHANKHVSYYVWPVRKQP